jgi:hypothetical protein
MRQSGKNAHQRISGLGKQGDRSREEHCLLASRTDVLFRKHGENSALKETLASVGKDSEEPL